MWLLITHDTRKALELDQEPLGANASSSPRDSLQARVLAHRLTALLPASARPVTAGELLAIAQLENALRGYLDHFRQERNPDVLASALERLDGLFGSEVVDRLLEIFEREFLPQGRDRTVEVAAQPNQNSQMRQRLLAEILIFSIIRLNPAIAHLDGALHEGIVTASSTYEPVVGALNELLAQEPALYGGGSSLIAELRRPFEAEPDSIGGQMRWVLHNWGTVGLEMKPALLAGLDLIAEEQAPRFPPGPGPTEVPSFVHLDDTEVRYAADRGWMSALVLEAKNSYVWLHQLSQRYGREIKTLDQIPEAELERLGTRGFTGLWLIGLWERSPASRRIKQLCGNLEAAGSAYSLLGYRVAADLGGDDALESLTHRAAKFGIRLSADMVPNHTGIDSDWMISHPDWFISVPHCPFPSYTFDGPNLSHNPDVEILLEDHYYDRSDAAVVFKRVDRRTGSVRFVYHGNDGTGTPWNDTAQLDYLNPEARKAVIRTILDVASVFPIIRFDAAMTLTKRHIQRLWYPSPGNAGAIPSRSEHGLTTAEFDRAMPTEFWRDVVERAETEAPNTLLLAEAFWLMESYFVRNLGLHRVYNSAFMNMLRDGDNCGFRKLLKEALEFDPEILRRYVNFLSNPDERTAIEQFGQGDRYFGACTLLATLPGLPMFAHGQIEGLAERYGMEYHRSYLDEPPNEAVVDRHEREIFPLLRERSHFARIENFRLHDLFISEHQKNNEVLAFSHRGNGKTTLTIFNNHPQATRGFLPDLDLELSRAPQRVLVFRDRLSGKRFVRATSETAERGVEVDLAGYESLILADFMELADPDGLYARLHRHLGPRGVPSLRQAARELDFDKAKSAFGSLLSALKGDRIASVESGIHAAVGEGLRHLEAAETHLARVADPRPTRESTDARLSLWLETAGSLEQLTATLAWPATERMRTLRQELLAATRDGSEMAEVLLAVCLLGALRPRWGDDALSELMPDSSLDHGKESRVLRLSGLSLAEGWLEPLPSPGRSEVAEWLAGWCERPDAARLLGYDADSDTMVSEGLEDFLASRVKVACVTWLVSRSSFSSQATAEAVVGWCDALDQVRSITANAGYRLDSVLQHLSEARATESTEPA